MSWIRRINRLSGPEKEGLYRILIPPFLFHHYGIDPLSMRNGYGDKVVRFFCPPGDGACFVEIKLGSTADPLYSIQLSDSNDVLQIDWDFLVVNDPDSPKFNTHLDSEGRDTLFGWAARNIPEEAKAMEAGFFPGQVRKGLRLTGKAIHALESFCRLLDIKTIRLEALFYHNAITFERYGFSYFRGYIQMKRIHELFRPGGRLCDKLDGSTPFRRPEYADTVRGRSWAIHDGILDEIDDDVLDEGWVSPVMYKMVDRPGGMITFPNPRY